jgi:hypothetical protein
MHVVPQYIITSKTELTSHTNSYLITPGATIHGYYGTWPIELNLK